MRDPALPRTRLTSQLLASPSAATPQDVVTAMGALQAQDYGSATWAIGARLSAATLTGIEQAFADGTLVRSWPLRGTLHVTAAADLSWMLRITAPYALTKSTLWRSRHGLTPQVLQRGEKLVIAALTGGAQRTRAQIGAQLAQAGLKLQGTPLQQLLYYLALHGLLCLGPRQGSEGTFVLLDAWAPKQRKLDDDEALATLATRYFSTRAPATAQDFAWWSGLPAARAREAMALAKVGQPSAPAPRGSAQLLPGYDEYLLSYKDRAEVLDPAHARKIMPGGNGIFLPMMVVDGHVVGTWKRTLTKRAVRIALQPFEPLGAGAMRALRQAAQRYGAFLERSVELS